LIFSDLLVWFANIKKEESDMMQRTLFQPVPDSENQYNNFIRNLLQIKDPRGKEKVIADLISDVKQLKLKNYEKKLRILLIDTVIKFGNVELVKTLATKFKKEGFADDIKTPAAENPEHPYRPVFWLAAIITRQPHVPLENYRAIERYLCENFGITKTININGKLVTREKYLAGVELWKHKQNVYFLTQRGMKLPRYRRHELMDAIEKGVALKPLP
jgi:hypothetical protein